MQREPSPSAKRFIIFTAAGDDLFALALHEVLEVLPMAALSKPPGMPTLLSGFLNVGGRLFAVIGIRALLGMPAQAPNLYTPLLLMRGSPLVALMVDKVVDVRDLELNNTFTADSQASFNGCTLATIDDKGHRVHILAYERLLLRKEQAVVEHFQALEEGRLKQGGLTS